MSVNSRKYMFKKFYGFYPLLILSCYLIFFLTLCTTPYPDSENRVALMGSKYQRQSEPRLVNA